MEVPSFQNENCLALSDEIPGLAQKKQNTVSSSSYGTNAKELIQKKD